MSGAVTIHVRDTTTNAPAAGIRMQVYWAEPAADVLLRAASTNDAGTTATPMVAGPKLSAGTYKLLLHVGDYFQQQRPDAPRCLDAVPVVFMVEDAAIGRRVEVDIGPTGYAVRCI